MTLPKNRDALVEIIARAICADDLIDREDIDDNWPLYERPAAAVLASIEATRCCVVPMDPTEEMMTAAEEMYMPMGEMIAAWDGAVSARPYAQPET
ncbi:hypothetical protein F1188_14955 [Roseospira marina]|uniref:Uncharacterized protein n=1 Tax=Roseospira marina TaxID=140057 RepID=A0A5M6IAG1_9PROT|nr:hypothetical protein [Roseospira marina]KAA5604709.1 hypothetical protein F1188_14955 [Roseospira marina]MBB4315157.1 hypothetical protein [Roseospira marina]MBB5088073.1 hypothetical protein [Roseospira marina]